MDITKQTYYYPFPEDETAAEGLDPAIEGGTQGAGPFKDLDLRKHTIEAYRRKESPFVAVAMKGVPFGTKFPLKLHGSDEEVPAMVVDTGGGLEPGTQVDIATETPHLAKGGGGGISQKAMENIPGIESAPGDVQIPMQLPGLNDIMTADNPAGIPDVSDETGQAFHQAIDESVAATPQNAMIAGEPTAASVEATGEEEPTTTEMTDTSAPKEEEGAAPPMGKLNKLQEVEKVDAQKGLAYFKNGTILDINSKTIYKTDPAGNMWMYPQDGSKPVKVKSANTQTVHPALMNQLVANGAPVAREDGTPFQSDTEAAAALAKFQKENEIPNKLQQSIIQQTNNAIQSSRNFRARPYYSALANFDRIQEVAAKPEHERTGLDDISVIENYGTVIHPNTVTTGQELAHFLSAQGLTGDAARITNKANEITSYLRQKLIDPSAPVPTDLGTKLLSQRAIDAMANAAVGEMAPRAKVAMSSILPQLQRLKAVGVTPNMLVESKDINRLLDFAGMGMDEKTSLLGDMATPQATPAPTNLPPPLIKSQSDYNNLPPGKYRALGPDGQIHTYTKAR